jgi:hypothetical protein
MTNPQAKNLAIMAGIEKHSSQCLPVKIMMIKQMTKRVVIVETTVIRFILSSYYKQSLNTGWYYKIQEDTDF